MIYSRLWLDHEDTNHSINSGRIMDKIIESFCSMIKKIYIYIYIYIYSLHSQFIKLNVSISQDEVNDVFVDLSESLFGKI